MVCDSTEDMVCNSDYMHQAQDVLTVQRYSESWNLDMSKQRFNLDLGNFSIAGPTGLEAVPLRG